MKLECGLSKSVMVLARMARRALGIRGEEGGALLEFAVVLPMLISILTGAASFSLAFYSLQQLQNATSGAVQAIAAEQGEIPNNDPCALAVTDVVATLPGWTTGNLTYTLTVTDSTGTGHTYGPTTGSSFTCAGDGTYEQPNEPVSLTVSYKYAWLPVLAFSPSSPLTSTEGWMAD